MQRPGRDPPADARFRGDGWEVWRDADGIVWTRDTRPQDLATALERVDAIERLLARPGCAGLLVDDTRPAGPDEPSARAAFRGFMDRHPDLRVAIVTTAPDTIAGLFEVARGGLGRNAMLFRRLEVARDWLRLAAGPGDAPGRAGRTPGREEADEDAEADQGKA